MALKELGKPVEVIRPRVIKAPIYSIKSGKEGRENRSLKFMLFGPIGSGKSFTIADMIRMGMKVFVMSTDLGGDGLITVQNELARTNELDKFDNQLRSMEVEGYENVFAFLENPDKYCPDFYTWEPDVFAWEGFSAFQNTDVFEYVGEQAAERAGLSDDSREIWSGREEGLSQERQDWGAIRNATVRVGRKFLAIRRPDGKPLHKLLTCHANLKQKQVQQGKEKVAMWQDDRKPMLSGAGGIMTGAGYDLVMETRVDADSDSGARRFTYLTQPTSLAATKNRGFALDPVEPANFKALWEKIQIQLAGQK